MGYLNSFSQDVFISYAHNDDDAYGPEPQGWVAQLDEDLRNRVAVFLDGEKPAVWRDRDIRSNDDFEEKISGRLTNAATFLSIISPSFFQRKWCLRELEEFAASAAQNLGIQIGEKHRIFKVEKVPVSVNRGALPDPLQGTGSYKFYGPDPEHQGKIHEYRPKLGGEYAVRYFREMDDLAQDIAMVLKQMLEKARQSDSAGSAQPAVYLAETTSDLEEEAREIRRDLKGRGFLVLPEGDLPYRVKDFRSKVQDCLKRSILSIHLTGKEYGFVPEGEGEKSNEWLQNEYAIEYQRATPNFLRLLWMPPGVTPADQRQRRYLDHLQNDPAFQEGADVLETKLEDLKSAIQEGLKRARNRQEKPSRAVSTVCTAPSEQEVSSSDEPLRTYVICDQLDLSSPDLHALRKYLFSQGIECILPSEAEDEREALQEHADNLECCDACLIYYGHGPDKWVGTKLRDLRKVLSRRSHPLRAKAIYVAPPDNASKSDFQTLEATVIRGSDSFEPATLAPFLNRLNAAVKKAGA